MKALLLTVTLLMLTMQLNCGFQKGEDEMNRVEATDPVPQTDAPAKGAWDFSRIDRILESASARIGPAGLLLIKDGQVVHRKAYRGFKLDVPLPAASATKWVSGALIMSLVDEGKLSLDDQVSKFLPDIAGDKAGITIRQLFSHTSGLPPEISCRNDKSSTLERCAEQIVRARLRAQPGTEFYYGGVSMHLGGRIAELASGRTWNDLFDEKLARPLGMTNTNYFSYGRTNNPRPAGDLQSTVDDFGKFLIMLSNEGVFDGRRILSEQSVAELHKDQTAGARIAYTIYGKHGRLNPALPQARYGIGVWREVVNANTGDIVEASSQGALGTSPWIDFEKNLAGVLIVRSSMSRVIPVYLEVKEAFREIVSSN